MGDEASLPLFLSRSSLGNEVTVALSGEGSDEIFLGYQAYARQSTISTINSISGAKAAVRALLRRFPNRYGIDQEFIGVPLKERYRGLSRVFDPGEVTQLLGESASDISKRVDSTYDEYLRKHPAEQMSYVDINSWLPDDLLVKADRMTMAASLELRVPFLDHKLVEFAWQLPVGMKLNGGTGKYVLKEAVGDLLPAEIIHRRKMGFPVPLDSWFRNDLAEFTRDMILGSGGLTEHLTASRLPQILKAHEVKDRSQQIYALLVLGSMVPAILASTMLRLAETRGNWKVRYLMQTKVVTSKKASTGPRTSLDQWARSNIVILLPDVLPARVLKMSTTS